MCTDTTPQFSILAFTLICSFLFLWTPRIPPPTLSCLAARSAPHFSPMRLKEHSCVAGRDATNCTSKG